MCWSTEAAVNDQAYGNLIDHFMTSDVCRKLFLLLLCASTIISCHAGSYMGLFGATQQTYFAVLQCWMVCEV